MLVRCGQGQLGQNIMTSIHVHEASAVQSRLFSNSTIPRYPSGDQMTAHLRWKTESVVEAR